MGSLVSATRSGTPSRVATVIGRLNGLGALVSVLLLVACDSPSPAPSPALTVESYCRARSERICAGFASCECERESESASCVATHTDSCVEDLARLSNLDVAAGLQAGSLRLDPQAIQACLDAYQSLADLCEGEGDLTPFECSSNIVANVAVGESCGLPEGFGEAYFLRCGTAAEGRCVAIENDWMCAKLPGTGQLCDGSVFCAPGLVCNSIGSTIGCTAPAALGEPCYQVLFNPCVAGLVCDTNSHCAAPSGAGGDCSADYQCVEGASCGSGQCVADPSQLGDSCLSEPNFDTCSRHEVCAYAPEQRTCREPLAAGMECGFGECASGLVCYGVCLEPSAEGSQCEASATCAVDFRCQNGFCVSEPGEGEACAAAGSEVQCRRGLGCQPADHTCQPAPGVGEMCLWNGFQVVCGEGLACGPGNMCVPITGLSTPCQFDATCEPGTYCEQSTESCASLLPDGAICAQSGCQPDSRCSGPDGQMTCQRNPGRGAPCFERCIAGLTCQGIAAKCMHAFCDLR